MIASELRLDDTHAFGADDAYREFKRKGYVIFERVLPKDLLAQMYHVWEEYFTEFSRRRPTARRLIMFLPFKAPLYDPRFIENPQVLAITDRALGKRYVCGYFATETPLPGAEYQPMHFDIQCFNRWKPLNRPLSVVNRVLGSLSYCYAIQVTVPLVDSTVDNAPLEVCPGTNRVSFKRAVPTKLLMPAGSILVRDLRNLHRGTPHFGTAPRPFVSATYVRTWAPKWRQPEIPLDVYDSLPARSREFFRLARIGRQVPSPEEWAK